MSYTELLREFKAKGLEMYSWNYEEINYEGVMLKGESISNLTIAAKREFNIGDVVIRTEPYALTLFNNAVAHYCSYCLKKQPSLLCGNCKVVKYCSEEC